MSNYDHLKSAIERYTSDPNGWGAELTFTAPTGEVAVINGMKTNIRLGVDEMGRMTNSKKAHISFSHKFLDDLAYPYRNDDGEVNLRGHLVSLKDSTGMLGTWEIDQWYPDHTIGLIPCILGAYHG